jgi:hypothetical protein
MRHRDEEVSGVFGGFIAAGRQPIYAISGVLRFLIGDLSCNGVHGFLLFTAPLPIL